MRVCQALQLKVELDAPRKLLLACCRRANGSHLGLQAFALAKCVGAFRRVLAAAGTDPGKIRFRYGVDARYAGQGNEVTVWVGERSCAVEAKSSKGGIRLHTGGAGEAGGVDVSSKGRGRVSFGEPAVAERNEMQIRTSKGKVEVRKGGE